MAAIPPDPTLFTSSWQSNDSLINFQPQAVPHIPRAWERAPHKPFAPQHRGREVWKRYDLRSKKPEHSTEISDGRDDASGQEEVFADTDRPIKRQCIINAPENAGAYQDQRPPRYIATLRARASGTPRRKLAKRKSLKSDRRKSVAGQISEGTDIPDEIARALKESEEDEDENSASERDIGHSDSMDSCANGEEGSDEATQAETLPPEEAEGLEEPQAPIVMETDEPGPAGNLQDNTKTLPAENEHEDTSATTPKNPAELNRTDGIHLERDPVVDDGAEDIIMEPSSKHDFTSHRSQSTLHKHKSPAADIQNDTVLETENILEHTSENIDQSPRNHTLSAMSEPVLHDQASDSNLRISNDESETIEPQLSSSTRSGSPACDAESVDSSPVVEPLTSLTSEGAFPRHQPATSPKPGQIIEVAQEEAESSRPEPDTDPSTAAANEANGPPPLPQSRTRSGTRFSDDTTLLQDFLNRARAHKAAKATRATPELSNPLDSAKPFSPPRRSPRRSPRKALFELDRNSPSPTKPRDVALRPKTPSKKTANPVESNDADDNDNGATTEPTSRRRSARTRLPTPVATNSQSAGPSLIPVVRRGVDEVVLAKSEAQELAGVTRANTRRNKGAAKLPALRMRMLGMEVEEEGKERESEGEGRGEGRAGKMVSWDGQLVYFREDVVVGVEGGKEKENEEGKEREDANEKEKEEEKEKNEEKQKEKQKQKQKQNPDLPARTHRPPRPLPTPAPTSRRLKTPGLPIHPLPAPAPAPAPAPKPPTAPAPAAVPLAGAKGTPVARKKKPGLGMGKGDGEGGAGGKMQARRKGRVR